MGQSPHSLNGLTGVYGVLSCLRKVSSFKGEVPEMATVLPKKRLGRSGSSVFSPEPKLMLDEQMHQVKVSILPVGLCIELLDTHECLPVPWEEVYKAAVRRHERNIRWERSRNLVLAPKGK